MLDALQPMPVNVLVNPLCVIHRLVDHIAVRAVEVNIIAEEIAMREHVRRDQNVLDLRVGIEEKGIAGIVVENDFVDFRKPHLAMDFVMIVDFAVAPVLRARGQTVRGNLVHDIEWDYLKICVKGIEARILRKFFNLF